MADLDKTNLEQDNRKKKTGKRMPIWMLIITDILLTAVCLGIFTLYYHVLPRHLASDEIVVATVGNGEDTTFTLPGSENTDTVSSSDTAESTDAAVSTDAATSTDTAASTDTSASTETANTDTSSTDTSADTEQTNSKPHGGNGGAADNKNTGAYTNYGNSDTLDISGSSSESDYIHNAQKTITEINNYSSDNIQFTTNQVEIGSGIDKITYYISDIYVTNVKYIKSAFATGEYGKNLREATLKMATDNNALLAINGDFYGNNEIGVVIRNGVLYRTEVYDADICVLFTDGTMKTYSPKDFNVDDVIAQGAWQAWIFGPQLLDGKGNILSTFNSTYYLSNKHPRTAIGYVEPGHYVFVVVDGRNTGYSRGVTLSELGQIMVDAGCVSAYNLDGGKSSAMVYKDAYVNIPAEGGRTVSDIIYLGE